jgi:hypothetical protein
MARHESQDVLTHRHERHYAVTTWSSTFISLSQKQIIKPTHALI